VSLAKELEAMSAGDLLARYLKLMKVRSTAAFSKDEKILESTKDEHTAIVAEKVRRVRER
jgi:hypothetical protein